MPRRALRMKFPRLAMQQAGCGWLPNLQKEKKLLMKGQWVNDEMRKEAGQGYTEGEPRLPRKEINLQGT
jgi:hypothetical protein